MTSRCARCVGSALPPAVCTAPMGKDPRATPTRTDTSDSGEKQRTGGKMHNYNRVPGWDDGNCWSSSSQNLQVHRVLKSVPWFNCLRSLMVMVSFLSHNHSGYKCGKFELDLTVIWWDKHELCVCFPHGSEARTAVSSMGFSMAMMAAGWPVSPPSVWQLSFYSDRSTPATQTTTFVGSSRRSFLILFYYEHQ